MHTRKSLAWTSFLAAPLSSAAAALLVMTAFGADKESFQLDARSSIYEARPNAVLDLTEEVTLEAWVQADRMPEGGGRIIDKSKPGTQLGYMLDTWPGNSLRFLNAKGMCRYDARL